MLCLRYTTLAYCRLRGNALKKHQRVPQEVHRGEAEAQPAEGRSSSEDSAANLSVQFTTTEAFGNFCVMLNRDRIPFGLAGFQTVLLAKEQLDHLPKASASFYQKCLREGLIKGSPPLAIDLRHWPQTWRRALGCCVLPFLASISEGQIPQSSLRSEVLRPWGVDSPEQATGSMR